MATRAVVLFSGGLDSMLVVKILQQAGIEVRGLNFRTMFACCKDQAAIAARELDIELSVVGADESYLDTIRKPQYGYGRGANPCIDCRIYMFRLARRYMLDCGASFVASGEVLGQRPKSQKRRDLLSIVHDSGLGPRLLRPLSARYLPRTWPELTGRIDRRRLYGFTGRSRKGLIALAHELGLSRIPQPSTGCALTERGFASKVHDLVRIDSAASGWDFELVKLGRHVRLDHETKVVVGRRGEENERLAAIYRERPPRETALLRPDNFAGPTALVVGRPTRHVIDVALGLIHRYSKSVPQQQRVRILTSDEELVVPAAPHEASAEAVPL